MAATTQVRLLVQSHTCPSTHITPRPCACARRSRATARAIAPCPALRAQMSSTSGLPSGPHRLVVRTLCCGRDNPGSTPGAVSTQAGMNAGGCVENVCNGAQTPGSAVPKSNIVGTVCISVCAPACTHAHTPCPAHVSSHTHRAHAHAQQHTTQQPTLCA